MNGIPDVPPYQELAAHYDELLGEQSFRKMREAFEWIVGRYGLRFRSAVDVGCGTGTFVEYLLRTGVDPVWGVDRSPEMLAHAVARNRKNAAQFLLQDLRELRLPERVDLLTCQFETLNYLLTGADLHTAFAGFARALTPRGFAVFDVAARRPGPPGPRRRIEFSRFTNHTVTIRARYDTERKLQVGRERRRDSRDAVREACPTPPHRRRRRRCVARQRSGTVRAARLRRRAAARSASRKRDLPRSTHPGGGATIAVDRNKHSRSGGPGISTDRCGTEPLIHLRLCRRRLASPLLTGRDESVRPHVHLG